MTGRSRYGGSAYGGSDVVAGLGRLASGSRFQGQRNERGAARRPLPLPLQMPRTQTRRVASTKRARRLLRSAVLIAVIAVAGVSVAVQLRRSVPAAMARVDIGSTFVVPGTPPPIPWPKQGEAAVAVPLVGVVVPSGPERPVPIASLAKMMTAYVVLRDHPLSTSQQGPVVTMTALDVAAAASDERQNETSIPVTAGEKLTERQLLDGLLVHSANNLAHTLARFDAGSTSAFVAKMNATAATLGLSSTHFVGPSGFNPGSVSTAADLLRLAAAAMKLPAFADVVAQPVVTLPGAGLLANYVSLVGMDGVVGVKSGFTAAAQGCVVLAARRYVGSTPVMVIAAVTGQKGYDALGRAQAEALAEIDAAARGLASVPVIAPGDTVGKVEVVWSKNAPLVSTTAAATVMAWPGQTVHLQARTRHLRYVKRGAPVGSIEVQLGEQHTNVPLEVDGSLEGPSLWWRLFRG